MPPWSPFCITSITGKGQESNRQEHFCLFTCFDSLFFGVSDTAKESKLADGQGEQAIPGSPWSLRPELVLLPLFFPHCAESSLLPDPPEGPLCLTSHCSCYLGSRLCWHIAHSDSDILRLLEKVLVGLFLQGIQPCSLQRWGRWLHATGVVRAGQDFPMLEDSAFRTLKPDSLSSEP